MMGNTTGISWATATWNPHYGCHKVSQGCKNCYMFRDMDRYGRNPNIVQRAKPATFNAPLTWARTGKVKAGARIFTCSWSDWFIDEAANWLDEAWSIIKRTPMYNYLILTKRPENIHDALPEDWGSGYPNVWLGVSVESPDYLSRIIPLEEIEARIKFVSYEPALAAVDFTTFSPTIDWIISGGESGNNPRPAELDWFRQVRDMCQHYAISYFHKQHGGSKKIDGAWGGHVLDGREWHEFPVEELA